MKTWFNEKFIPTMGKLGNQRHLAAIRDAFAIFTPIIIMGALAVLWRSVIFNPWGGKGTISGMFFMFNDWTIQDGSFYYHFASTMRNWFTFVQTGTINMMAIYLAFGVAYFLATSRQNTAPVIAGLLGMASFLAVTMVFDVSQPWDAGGVTWEGGMYWLGARGLVSALIMGLLSSELFCWLSKGDRMAISLPAGVPPAVSRAFAKMFPVFITLSTMALINLLVTLPYTWEGKTLYEGAGVTYYLAAGTDLAKLTKEQQAAITALIPGFNFSGTLDAAVKLGVADGSEKMGALTLAFGDSAMIQTVVEKIKVHGGVNFTSAIYCWIVAPFIGLADNTAFAFGLALFYVLLVSFFWFFGLHGTNIVNGAFNPIWLILLAENMAGAKHVFVAGTFDAYIFLGGWGATLALVIASLLVGDRKSAHYQVAKFSLAPGIFNINEPVTFGYPLVLNAILAIPLFLVMPVLVVTTWMGIEWFGVNPVTVMIPWTMPVGFGGMLASAGFGGFVLAVVNLAIATLIWLPFVLVMNKTGNSNASEKALETEEGKKIKAKQEKAATAVKAGN